MNKNLKNDKIKIIGIVSVFIACICGSFFLIFKTMNLKDKDVPKTQTEQEMQDIADEVISDEDKEILSSKEQMALAMGDFMNKYENSLKLGRETNPEYPETDSKLFYNELVKKAETAEFPTILSMIEKKASKYKFHEEYNWKIGNLYYDSTLMIATLDAPFESRGHMVKNMKDPTMLMIGTLLLPEESRRAVIGDVESLSPIFDGAVVIKKHEIVEINEETELKDDFMDIILTETFSVKKIHKYNFEVELNPLIAYIVEHEDGTLEFFTIKQDGNYECYYKTIGYWLELDEKLNKKPSSNINSYTEETTQTE